MPIAVLLRTHPGQRPLSSIHAQLGPLDMLTVELPAYVILAVALHPIVGSVVCNFKQFIKDGVGTLNHCARVLFC